MAVTSLVTDIREFMHDTESANYRWTDARILRLIDQAQKDLVRKANALPTVQASVTADGTEFVAIGYMHRFSRATVDGCPLTIKTAMDTCIDTSGNKGKPQFGLLRGNNLYFYPIADDVYDIKVKYSKKAQTIDSLTDTLEVAEECEQAIKNFVCGNLYRDDKDTQSRQMGVDELQLYATELAQLKKELSLQYTAGNHYEMPYRKL